MRKPTKKTIAKWKVVRKKWVEALRSNKYEQGDGQLARDGKYCCLGVLCDVIDMVPIMVRNDIYFGAQYQFAPRKAMDSVGLCGNDGSFINTEDLRRINDSLADKNDQFATFDDIADIIESEPEGLFKETMT